MENFLTKVNYVLIITAVLVISCKKDQQPIITPTTQQSLGVRKIDTVFQYTATNNGSYSSVIQTQRDFYFSALDTINTPRLKVFRALNSGGFLEINPYSPSTVNLYYIRNQGKITYSEFIVGYSSVGIRVRILAKW
jgi:hypothetical protein